MPESRGAWKGGCGLAAGAEALPAARLLVLDARALEDGGVVVAVRLCEVNLREARRRRFIPTAFTFERREPPRQRRVGDAEAVEDGAPRGVSASPLPSAASPSCDEAGATHGVRPKRKLLLPALPSRAPPLDHPPPLGGRRSEAAASFRAHLRREPHLHRENLVEVLPERDLRGEMARHAAELGDSGRFP